MLVPKSLDPVARGRKMPLPDPRPSEKIAKLFPQADPQRTPPKDQRRTPHRPQHSSQPPLRKRQPTPAAGAPAVPLPASAARRQTSRSGARSSSHRHYRNAIHEASASPRFPNCRPPRRKRALSEEERALWESVAKQIKPLRKKPRAAKAQPPPRPRPMRRNPLRRTSRASPARMARAPKPELPPAPPPLAPLGRRERSQLSRGRKEIDARLDLHGMTQTRAHRALSDFLHRAHGDGLTFVLVITGKGKMGVESERGVLRRQVPQWLGLPEFRSLVVGFEEAHIGHGGEGALYVRDQAIANLSASQKRSYDPDPRDRRVTIQPKIDGLFVVRRHRRHSLRGGQGLHRMQDQEHADRPV